jgi:hypothetical protein
MNWFLVTLMYTLNAKGKDEKIQLNQQLRMILAEDALHALFKGRLLGERETIDGYKNGSGYNWKFIDVADVVPMKTLNDGAQVWSSINEEIDADSYIRNARSKSNALFEEAVQEFNTLNESPIGA